MSAEYLSAEYRASNLSGNIIDIGCNVGDFVEWCLRFSKVNKILAFDIDNEHITNCKLRFGDNEKVTFSQSAVYHTSGDKIMAAKYSNFDKDNTGLGTLYTNSSIMMEVITIKLDDIIESLGSVDFLKIDCEGAEYDILYNSKSLNKVNRISGEFHTGYGSFPDKNNISALSRHLFSNGFDVEFSSAKWAPSGNRGNFWATKRNA